MGLTSRFRMEVYGRNEFLQIVSGYKVDNRLHFKNRYPDVYGQLLENRKIKMIKFKDHF